jgi:chromosome segregation ATPase
MPNIDWTHTIELLVALAGGILGGGRIWEYFSTRRKEKAEAESTLADAKKKTAEAESIEIGAETSGFNEERAALNRTIDHLTKRIEEVDAAEQKHYQQWRLAQNTSQEWKARYDEQVALTRRLQAEFSEWRAAMETKFDQVCKQNSILRETVSTQGRELASKQRALEDCMSRLPTAPLTPAQ